MQGLTSDTVREIHEIISNRIAKAPSLLKDKFGFKYNNQKIFIEEFEQTLVILLLNPKEQKSLKWRQKKGIMNFPALATQNEKLGLIRLENTSNAMVRGGGTLQGPYGFSVGPNSSAIIESITIAIAKSHVGPLQYTIDLGFIIRPPIGVNLCSLTEVLDDLVVYYIKSTREASNDLTI